MKKYILLPVIVAALFMTGCETTREIMLNSDNSGTYSTTTDMSGVMGMAKMAAQGKDVNKSMDKAIDTTFMLDKAADSLKDATKEEKELVKKGKCHFQLSVADEKFVIKMQFPFSDPTQIPRLEKLSTKLMADAMDKQMTAMKQDSVLSSMQKIPDEDDLKVKSSIEDYFITTFSKKIIEKKLNKEKYATVDSDESMKALKEMSGMGSGNNTLIINLPRPAKKAEGKNVKLSDDKKKVTIETSTEDFFDDPAALEFRIEY